MLPLILAQTDDSAPPTMPDGLSAPAEGTATTTQPGAPGAGDPAGQQAPGGMGMIWVFLIVIVVMWVFMIGGQRKEKKKRQELLNSLSKGAKVQTVGGILGTVVEVRDDEVVVKVDENTNARLRFARSAIQTVHEDEKD